MGATLMMIGVRQRRPLEDNWPLLYWLVILMFAFAQPDIFNLEAMYIGLAAGLMLRFEFMNASFARVFKGVELGVWVYVLVRGVDLVTS